MTYELVPIGMNQRSIAKKEIQTFKDHLVALSGVEALFSMQIGYFHT